MRGLYAIVDLDFLATRGVDAMELLSHVIAGGARAVQLRAKHASARETLERLRAMVTPCRAAGVPLLANDRPDLALLAGVDGVHVGQEDLGVADVRRVAPGLSVGVSTHDLEQVSRAIAGRPDYIAFGPVFATGSKANPDPVVGLEGLARARELCLAAGIPLVAIGGITQGNVTQVAELADAAAVISALLPEPGCELGPTQARALAQAWGAR